MAVISINCEEFTQKNIESVEVYLGHQKFGDKKIFDSGNIVKDWARAMKYIITEMPQDEFPVVFSSSVDHFLVDGDEYEMQYLNIVEGKYQLTQKKGKYGFGHIVRTGSKLSWDELKEYVSK